MLYIDTVSKLKTLLVNPIPAAETAKVAIVRPTTHFQIVTADNPDMQRTLEEQKAFIEAELKKETKTLSSEQRDKKIELLKQKFQEQLSQHAYAEQKELLNKMKRNGIPTAMMVEDKGELETAAWDYFTDQIFATDVGQYYDDNGVLNFIPANFKNKQRQGEERLAIAQAHNINANVQTLYGAEGEKLIFEGGDIRQMPGKKLFFIGQGHRSDSETSKKIAEVTGYYVIPIRLLQAQFYHLDCCFLPLPHESAVIYEGEYQHNSQGEKILDVNGWPKLIAGTETMTAESRALIRTIYPANKLVLINKEEALAFATNAAVLQSPKDARFKMFVNGDSTSVKNTNEENAIHEQKISFTSEHKAEIRRVTDEDMDIVEVPYSTMHGSGGSVRCTVQEVACNKTALTPQATNQHFFGDTLEKLEKQFANRRPSKIGLFHETKPNQAEAKSATVPMHSTRLGK